MERETTRRFSLDPYIDGGGSFGTRMTVNEIAAGKIVSASGLERDIFITKKQLVEEDKAEIQGDSLLLKRFVFPRLTINSTPLHDVGKSNTTFTIGVDDDKLQEQSDANVSKRYKAHQGISGHTLLQQEFLKGFNSEVLKGLIGAIFDEKLGFEDHKIAYLFKMGVLGDLYSFMVNHHLIGLSGPAFGFKIGDVTRYNAGQMRHRLDISPTLFIHGLAQIIRNRKKIIIEKENALQ